MFLPFPGRIRKANSSSSTNLEPIWAHAGLIQADHSLSGITSRASIIFSSSLQLSEWNNNYNYTDAEVTIALLLTCVTLTVIPLPVHYLTRTRTY